MEREDMSDIDIDIDIVLIYEVVKKLLCKKVMSVHLKKYRKKMAHQCGQLKST